jgi:hypothetical protein
MDSDDNDPNAFLRGFGYGILLVGACAGVVVCILKLLGLP